MDPMLSDEERLEEIKKWWKTHGMSLVGGLALGVAIVWGWGYFQDVKKGTKNSASSEYNVLTSQISTYERTGLLRTKPDKKTESIIQIQSEELIKKYGDTVYAVDSSLILAKLAVSKNNLKEAQKRLQWVVSKTDSDSYKHHIGRIRLARVQRDQKQYAAALKTLDVTPPSQFSMMYNFIKGTVYERQSQCSQARSAYQISIKVMESQEKSKQNQLKDLKQTIQRRLENVQNC